MKDESNNNSKIIVIIIIIICILFLIAIGIAAIRMNSLINEISEYTNNLNRISRHLSDSENYIKIASFPNKVNNSGASVYEISLESVDAAARDIIKNADVIKVTDDGIDETNDVGLFSDTDEFVYIYEKDEKIYLQYAATVYFEEGSDYKAYHEDKNDNYLAAYKTQEVNTNYDYLMQDLKNKQEIKDTPIGSGVSPVK